MGILFSKQPEVDAKPEALVQETVVHETISSETSISPPTITEPVVVEPTPTNIVETPTDENIDSTRSNLFERAIEQQTYNKVEVVPIIVNPGADVVKKTNKKKNKKSKSV